MRNAPGLLTGADTRKVKINASTAAKRGRERGRKINVGFLDVRTCMYVCLGIYWL